jgi:ATP-dependent DNA helicase DinG
MIIKLKQGVGRLIRNETDTGVISILDSRLKVGGNYRDRVIKALPDCRLAGSVLDVEKFIREKKCDLYFSGQ